jgi:Putative quorum-sensing-regulated virulence factor
MLDPYAELHLLPSAPPEVVDAAYRALVKLLHPDWVGPGSMSRMVALNNARDAIRAGVVPFPRERTSEPPAAQVEMPWGKYKGVPLRRIPSDYLQWLLANATSMHPALRDDIWSVLSWRRSAASA